MANAIRCCRRYGIIYWLTATALFMDFRVGRRKVNVTRCLLYITGIVIIYSADRRQSRLHQFAIVVLNEEEKEGEKEGEMRMYE